MFIFHAVNFPLCRCRPKVPHTHTRASYCYDREVKPWITIIEVVWSRDEFKFARHNTVGILGATENAGVENAIRSKLQGWKMQEWKKQE